MAMFSQPACSNNDVMFTFSDDLKVRMVLSNEDKMLSFEPR